MLQHLFIHPASFTLFLHLSFVVTLSVRIIMKRPATGVALAWLLLIASFPFGGALIYLLIGERRIGGRAGGIRALNTDYRRIAQAAAADHLIEVDWSRHPRSAFGMDQIGQNMVNSPTVRGNSFSLCSNTEETLQQLARDIDSATKSVLMEFYIWNEGGLADEVLEAVIRAAKRGVACFVLVDALGARPWWKGLQPRRLREAGVDLQQALPVGLFRTLVGRTDLRLHRKIVVIDGTIAWTGSMNLVDPRFFKQDSGVGEWVDAMVRLHGPVVIPLASTMIGDWILETGGDLTETLTRAGLQLVDPQGTADIQVIASGPGESGDGLLQMILALLHAAETELILTTPYLVPDESLLRAIRGAAGRGVQVKLIVPEKVDSFMTRHASHSYFDDLLDVGVEIYLYRGGLLHTKSIMVDRAMSMFGTVNLDMRSFWLNYEVALFIYEPEFAGELRNLQLTYLDDSIRIEPDAWGKRSFGQRFLENTMRLVSPLL